MLFIFRSRRDSKQLFLGLGDSLVRLSLEAGEWHDSGHFENIPQVRSMTEDDQGRLWMGTRAKGVVRLEADASPSDPASLSRFGVADGLPIGWLETRTIAGEVRVLSLRNRGLFRMDSRTGPGHFVPDTTLWSQGGPSIRLVEDDQGRVWIAAGEASVVAQPSAEGYTFMPTALRRAPDLRISTIVAETDGPVWIGHSRGLVRLDTEDFLDPTTDYAVWIRRITVHRCHRRKRPRRLGYGGLRHGRGQR